MRETFMSVSIPGSGVVYREDQELLDVRAFHEKFGMLDNEVPWHLTKRKLLERADCMQEELNEFRVAVEAQDMVEMADGLIDIAYFAKGTAAMMGLPWRALWDDVHAANMRKVRGTTHRGHLVDVMKPPGWIGPRTNSILMAFGYRESMFMTGQDIDETKCMDDDTEVVAS